MDLIIKIISLSDGQRGCSRSKAHGTFPSGVLHLQRRDGRVDKKTGICTSLGLSVTTAHCISLPRQQGFPLLLPQWLWFTSWLFPKPTYVLFSSPFSGLCLCLSVSVSRFLTLAIKENLLCNTKSNTYHRGLSLSKFIRIWTLIYNLLHPTTSAFELQEFKSCVLPKHPNIISSCVKDALGITCPVSERFQ